MGGIVPVYAGKELPWMAKLGKEGSMFLEAPCGTVSGGASVWAVASAARGMKERTFILCCRVGR